MWGIRRSRNRYYGVTNPYTWTFLQVGRGATVHNIALQDGCEQDFPDYLTMMHSPRAASIAPHAQAPAGHRALGRAADARPAGGGV